MRAEVQSGSVFGERLAIHQFRARLGQRAFIEAGKFFVEFASEHKLQNGVAEELETLVGLHRRTLLVSDRWMRERELQQLGVAEGIPQFQFLVFGHFASQLSFRRPLRREWVPPGPIRAARGSRFPRVAEQAGSTRARAMPRHRAGRLRAGPGANWDRQW